MASDPPKTIARCVACKHDLLGQSPPLSPGQFGEVLCPACGVRNLPPSKAPPGWGGGDFADPTDWRSRLLWTLGWLLLLPLVVIGIWLLIRLFP